MRVLLTGGGTAGHINPALAIAETILRNAPGSVVEFVGVAGGKEDELVPRAGYKLHHVKSTAVQGSKGLGRLKSLALAATSPYLPSTVSIIKKFKPDIVIGTGGFACWPIMAAAARMGIPTAVHESNALPGLAVRRLQKKVDRIWINFERTAELLSCPEKALRVGNPLRDGFGGISKEEARRRLGIEPHRRVILSFGGSLGATRVNQSVLDLMKEVSSKDHQVLHLHATGKREYQEVLAKAEEKGLDQAENCVILDYIYDMPLQMAAADLIIARAGAMTLSELSLMSKAAILIPSPNVADNHQLLNAKTLADAGAACLVEEKDLEMGSLILAVRTLLESPQKMSAMEQAIADFADPKANQHIWEEIQKAIGPSTEKTKITTT